VVFAAKVAQQLGPEAEKLLSSSGAAVDGVQPAQLDALA
jgi:hypothetical protein